MGNPNPSKSTRFQKGKSGNPGGRPPLPPHLKEVAELTADELKRTIARHLRMTDEELEKVLNNPKSIALDMMFAAAIRKTIEKGDLYNAEYLFQRSLGKVKDTMEAPPPPEPVVIKRIDGTEIELGTKKVVGE